MSGTYRKQIEGLVRELEANQDIVLHRAEIGDPASDDAIATATTYAAFKLPRGVKTFYRELNGLHLEWEYQGSVPEGQEPDRGAIQLLPIERIFGMWKDIIWFDDGAGGERFQSVKPFDLFQSEACMAFIQQPDEAPQEKVHFHYIGEDLCATRYSFTSYLKRLIAARGYLYWQLSLCPNMQDDDQVKRFKERMPVLFPDFTATLFKP